MKLSLRQKLAFLMALAICAAVIPYSFYAARNLASVALEREKADFRTLGALVHDNLSAIYFNYLSGRVADIIRYKEQLRKIGFILSRNWSGLEVLEGELRGRLIEQQTRDLKELGLVMAVVDINGRPVAPFDRVDFAAAWNRMVDFTGLPLTSSLDPAKLPPEGRFSVYRLPAAQGETDVFLGLLLPEAVGRYVVICLIEITDLLDRTVASPAEVVEDMRQRLEDIHLKPGTSVSLVTAEGRSLVCQGAAAAPVLPEELLEAARRDRELELLTELPEPLGRSLIRVEHFKPLDWYVILARPEESVIGPAHAQGLKLALAGGLVALLSLIPGLWAGDRLIKPLALLSRKAHEAAGLDLNDPEAESFFTRDLPTGRRDEIGALARDFSRMGLALAAKVRQLVAGTAAAARLEAELKTARDIQLGMLPPPAPPGAGLRAYLSPAKEVGGDLYDYFTAPCGRLVTVIGDVSDKGVPAALFMAMTVALIRQAATAGLGPAETLTQVNERLAERNPSSMFVTLFIGFLDPGRGDFTYANAGHCFPLLRSSGGPDRFLEGKSGPMVGVFQGVEYKPYSDIIEENGLCLLYTDGVTEAQDEKGGFFGSERLAAALAGAPDASPAGAVQAVESRVREFQGQAPQADDITVLAFSRN
ncbi:MAG: SpoIIE family protein phosphatase [Deltaproteobacteria bacterium]|jgi:sigma-B regulation protein RsbU (phosphoserine phosphatase)|nr:SpoIIE family protein phosphatase [Deltaproteobacteria bacterium]